jgi:DNA-directed RNA polymerase specialized sigma24 family protein
MRWAAAAGSVDPGRGPATRRTGEAFLLARETIERAHHQGDGLLCRTGDARADALLEDLAPVVAEHVGRMTGRQREIARLIVVDGSRQSEVATVLGVTRPTVSSAFRRGDVRSLERLVSAVRSIWRAGIASRTSVPVG